jgi:hypothetical protein
MMKQKLIVSATVLILISLMTTVVFARSSKGLKVQDPLWDLGSLKVSADATGLGSEDAVVTLDATGRAVVICTSPGGGSEAPGQNPTIKATGSTLILAGNIDQNGKAPFVTETDAPPPLNAKEAGCPNPNWSSRIDFIFWDSATITINQGDISASFKYVCTTTRNPDSVTCTPVGKK